VNPLDMTWTCGQNRHPLSQTSCACWGVGHESPILPPPVDTERPNISAPDYYLWVPGIECREVVQHFPHNVACAMKYCWRAGRKTPDPREDYEKAIEYLQAQIELYTNTHKESNK